eukprot:5328906-Pleurochrysis_carterae.AAC.3
MASAAYADEAEGTLRALCARAALTPLTICVTPTSCRATTVASECATESASEALALAMPWQLSRPAGTVACTSREWCCAPEHTCSPEET